jgi:hypothetical protein
LSAHSRKLLWLSVWVTGFAVAMACLLLVFKHRAALDGLQRDRLERVADEIDATVSRSLAIGMPFTEIAVLPEVLDSQKSTEALVAGIDVADAEGRVLYSTRPERVRGDIGAAWRAAIARAKERQWHARDGDIAVVGGTLRNAFGLIVGHVLVRYELAALEKSSHEFAKRLAAWGAAIAAASALLVFLMLGWVQGVVERRLARARAALHAEPPRPARPGSLTGEASAARATIEAAHRELDAAEAAVAKGVAT